MYAPVFDRRSFLGAGAIGALALALSPRMAFAKAETDKRFIFIIQRGAADGMGIVAPVGDPAFAGARGDLAADFAGAPKLDGMFALHPAMTSLQGLYGQKQALFAHAVASPYRDRSHFDGQNVLETGGRAAYAEKTGWMNRLIPLLPDSDRKALAVATDVPMALRGPAPVTSYAPLHMAARRGTVEIAQALIDCGARVNVRDRRGDTPLRRALKCRKQALADLLLSNGASPV